MQLLTPTPEKGAHLRVMLEEDLQRMVTDLPVNQFLRLNLLTAFAICDRLGTGLRTNGLREGGLYRRSVVKHLPMHAVQTLNALKILHYDPQMSLCEEEIKAESYLSYLEQVLNHFNGRW